MSSWRDVHAFSQPLVMTGAPDEIIVSTPMRFANIIRLNAIGEREVVSMRWGFAGKGDANLSRPKHMHARSETIDRLRTFANAFARGRGILVVHTFNEGEELPNGKTKQWVITPNDGKPIAIAVICETWSNGAETLDTFIQVTTPANALISKITDRMPAILEPDDWAIWLGENGRTAGRGEGGASDVRRCRQLDNDRVRAGAKAEKAGSAAGVVLTKRSGPVRR